MIGILYNIRSVYNTASIFRVSDCVGIQKLFLVGYTPSPIDNFGNKRNDFLKVSLGSENSVDFSRRKDVLRLIGSLQNKGFFIVGLETKKYAIPYYNLKCNFNKCALLVGNEAEGIPDKVLKRCDEVAKIPMFGEKESLNVAIAFSIAAFHLRFK